MTTTPRDSDSSPEVELIQRCRAMGAGLMRQVYYDTEDRPIALVLTVDGTDDCAAVLDFVALLEADRG